MPAIIGYFSSSFGSGICAFYSRIFQAKEFSPYEIGILISANPLLNMTLLPVLSYLADKFCCQTAMLFVCIVIATVSMFGHTIPDRRVPTISWFLVMTASRVSLSPLLDQRILMMFPKQERSNAWSYARSYAAYGLGIGSFVASLVFLYTVSWVAVTVQHLLGQIGLAYSMVVIKPYERTERVPVHFVEELKVLRTNKRLMLFLFSSTMMGAGCSFIDNFLGELGGSEVLMDFAASTEIPLFQMSARPHQTLTERRAMAIAMSVWAFRVVRYTTLTNTRAVLLIVPMRGVAFAFTWLPSLLVVSRAFPLGLPGGRIACAPRAVFPCPRRHPRGPPALPQSSRGRAISARARRRGAPADPAAAGGLPPAPRPPTTTIPEAGRSKTAKEARRATNHPMPARCVYYSPSPHMLRFTAVEIPPCFIGTLVFLSIWLLLSLARTACSPPFGWSRLNPTG
ncbi:membrane transporter, putative [Leishmania panamensis]|uniref:membrane transporter, putative n=1 Tax=Leishmania panamensis TaxID=5679 RepID=UPI0004F8C289|nr:membrane transporter, putative [Leishmania panamensis]AIO01958.1 membrane transporter, putative [Leishmania panamensis]